MGCVLFMTIQNTEENRSNDAEELGRIHKSFVDSKQFRSYYCNSYSLKCFYKKPGLLANLGSTEIKTIVL